MIECIGWKHWLNALTVMLFVWEVLSKLISTSVQPTYSTIIVIDLILIYNNEISLSLIIYQLELLF